jgi:hypothetical protein
MKWRKKVMGKIFSVTIQFKGDSPEDVLIYEFDGYDNLPDGYNDDDIFFYGMSENNILEAIDSGELCENEWAILELHEIIGGES